MFTQRHTCRAQREGAIHCPFYPHSCQAAPFSDWDLARALPCAAHAAYTQARVRLLEDRLAQAKDEEVRAEVAAELQRLEALGERERKVLEARKHLTDRILNHSCPRCGQVFVDFTGCVALACSGCPSGFCGWCMADAGRDAHAHVEQCLERPAGLQDPHFAPFAVWERHHRERRAQRTAQYLRLLPREIRAEVAGQIQQQLRDLGLDVATFL